jgi:hypothetical protein
MATKIPDKKWWRNGGDIVAQGYIVAKERGDRKRSCIQEVETTNIDEIMEVSMYYA